MPRLLTADDIIPLVASLPDSERIRLGLATHPAQSKPARPDLFREIEQKTIKNASAPRLRSCSRFGSAFDYPRFIEKILAIHPSLHVPQLDEFATGQLPILG
jgi:hypothetical protein